MPLQSTVHTDSLLTNLSIAYRQTANYIADKVFPVIPVSKQSDLYRVYEKGSWFRDDARKRADTTEAAETDFTMSTSPYYADVWAVKQLIGDQTLANHDAPGNLMQEATRFVTDKLLLRRENQFVADYFGQGIWSYDHEGVAFAADDTAPEFTQWSDYTNSNPIQDIEDAKLEIVSTTGLEANTLVFGRQVWPVLRNHPDIIDRIAGGATSSNPAIADLELIARVFGVERVLVANALKNTAKEGAADSFAFTAGKGALLVHAATSPGLMTPSAGYTFAWTDLPNGLPGASVAVKRYRDEPKAAEVVEAQTAFDNKVVAPELGAFFRTAVA